MLIWINGPFGGGKTVTAYELAGRHAGIPIAPGTRGRVRAWVRRTAISARHIRVDLVP